MNVKKMVKKLTKYCCTLLTLGAVEAMEQPLTPLASPEIIILAMKEMPLDSTPAGWANRLAYIDKLPIMDPIPLEITSFVKENLRIVKKHFTLCPTFSYFNEGAKFYNSLNEKYSLKEEPFAYNFTLQSIANAIWRDNLVFVPVITIVAGATFWLNASLGAQTDVTEPHSYQTDLGTSSNKLEDYPKEVPSILNNTSSLLSNIMEQLTTCRNDLTARVTNILPCDSDACKTKYGIICNFKSFNDAMHNVPYSKGGPISFGAPYPSLKINYPLNVAYPECKYHRPQ